MQEMDYSGKRDAEKLCMKRRRYSCTAVSSVLICKTFIQNLNSKLLIRMKRVIRCHPIMSMWQKYCSSELLRSCKREFWPKYTTYFTLKVSFWINFVLWNFMLINVLLHFYLKTVYNNEAIVMPCNHLYILFHTTNTCNSRNSSGVWGLFDIFS